jgi:hypothetical protein
MVEVAASTRYSFDAHCRYGSPVAIGIPIPSRDKKASRCGTGLISAALHKKRPKLASFDVLLRALLPKSGANDARS